MPDYSTYDASALAQDDSFIRWVRGGDAPATRFWDAWLADHPERKKVVVEARQLVEALRFEEKAPSAERVDALWARIGEASGREELAPPAPRAARLRSLRWLAYAAAAGMLILLVLQLRNAMGWELIETEAGKQLVHTLPDGSVVELNGSTALRYRPGRFGSDRKVHLAGEAFFYVEKGSAFRVHSGWGSVEVLGTTFNVYARDDNFAVDCFSGRVAVSLESGGIRTELMPGRGASLDTKAGELIVYDFKKEEKAAWRQRMIYYDNEALSQVFDTLGELFGVTVIAPPDAGDRKVTGFFPARNLEEALREVAWPAGLAYEIRKDTVIFRERGGGE